MMGHAYYLIGLAILFLAISNIIYFNGFYNTLMWIKSFKKISGIDPIQKDFRSKHDYDVFSTFNTFAKAEFIWFFFGLITKSWIVFLVLILLSFLFNIIVNSKFTFIGKVLGFLFELAKSLIIFALIINHFHIHFNWIDLL